ncbi:dihydrodipicolinate synthase family protein [uncultured Martelella sp.]|uniref:dihydrodipicolinate synthase family protein n=1 Tax=uncultured Martelella sp. TaxID=392331 RepID=UPI0029C7FDF6|nr:dihydrodipicolinate synthase family protein [uncultured Martelella sp.]
MYRPKGVISALLTPFGADHRLNEGELRRLVEFDLQGGVDGIFPESSVGEAVHMDFAEKCRCMEIVVDQVAGRATVLPGIAASSPYEAARLAIHAAQLGCPAVVASAPYYFKPDQEMLVRFFEVIIEECDVPIILYNIPLFAEPLSYGLVEKLSANDKVVGIKDSSGSMVDFQHFLDIISRAESQMTLLTGREETLVPSLQVGGTGCVTASACIFPEIMSGIYKAYHSGDLAAALEMQRSILPLVRAMFQVPFPAAFKAALELRGFDMGAPMLPLSRSGETALTNLKQKLRPMMDAALRPWGGLASAA